MVGFLGLPLLLCLVLVLCVSCCSVGCVSSMMSLPGVGGMYLGFGASLIGIHV